MPRSNRPALAEYVSDFLRTKYGSLSKAASKVGIGYDGLKKQIQLNSFSRENLEILFPDEGIEFLQATYSFSLVRSYRKNLDIVPATLLRLHGLETGDIELITENKVIELRIVALIKEECARLREILVGAM